jgi:hypothetical protein
MIGRTPMVRRQPLAPSLPAGEVVLWQGAPSFRSLVRRALHLRTLGIYFAALVAWNGVAAFQAQPSAAAVGLTALRAMAVSLAVLGFVTLVGWLVARTTRYTITSRRVLMRIGVALPMTLNIPFAIVGGAGLKVHADGTGDIPLALTGSGRAAYLHLWPHARPWRLGKPEPMLRCVPEAARVATILGHALQAVSGARTAAEPTAAAVAGPALAAAA